MKNTKITVAGKIVDIFTDSIYNGEITIENGKIIEINKTENEYSRFIMPGFVDAHVHIESSMLVPSEFAKLAVRQGTVATVSDPHEIANVLGMKGVEFMIKNGESVPFKFYFGAPSCVPATPFETSGAVLNSKDVRTLLKNEKIHYLSEVMNFPGVIYDDEEMFEKINSAIQLNKQIDGHAPGLSGNDLKKYAAAGITTDHESSSLDEAIEKIKLGIKLLIREGSAAKNFTALYKAIDLFPKDVMLCTDDSHPNDLILGHINSLIKKGILFDVNMFNLIRAATLNPIKHYNLDVGLLQIGDPADFIVLEDLRNFKISQTYINGNLVFDNGTVLINSYMPLSLNNFNCSQINESQIQVNAKSNFINVIEACDGELLTKKIISKVKAVDGFIKSNTKKDILKIVVLNRYSKTSKPVVGFINGFRLKKGAIASSIAHDSHNIIAVGVSDKDIVNAINTLIRNKGGIVVANDDKIESIVLEVAGLMTNKNGILVAEKYKELNKVVKKLGTKLNSPFMTLSFMALLVIPELKIGDKGLFDVEIFKLIDLFVD